jgi:diguanylate cyclase (GGDEF)-like protein
MTRETMTRPEKPMKFMLVEDDPDYVEFLKVMIWAYCKNRFEVVIATSSTADDAVAKLHEMTFDVCFLDYYLDDGSTGLDVLRNLEPQRLPTVFIFLTVRNKKETAFEALQLGAMDYLLKAKFDEFDFAKSISYALYRKQREVDLQAAALRDALTGLGNRSLFEEKLNTLLKQAKRAEERVGIMYIDLNGFKRVNDTHGHLVGDELLKQVAERLVEATRDSDVVARVGGDEFAAILFRVEDPDAVRHVAEKVEKSIAATPFQINEIKVLISASVGAAVYPDDTENFDELIRLADKRMYEMKRAQIMGEKKMAESVWLPRRF